MNKFFRRLLGLFLALALSASPVMAEEVSDWLLSKQIDLYIGFFSDANFSSADRIQLQRSFHKFAFEYWLAYHRNQNIGSPVWRGYIRRILHQDGKNEQFFNDPAALIPFFDRGKLVGSFPIATHWLDSNNLNETDYKNLVTNFQTAFFDIWTVFPTNQVPSGSIIQSKTASDDGTALQDLFTGKTWLAIRIDRFPVALKHDPLKAFRMLTPLAQAYYLPAFLRMCEREPEFTKDFPQALAADLARNSDSAKELRSKLNTTQKKCVIVFFEDWYQDGPRGPISSGKLRKSLN